MAYTVVDYTSKKRIKEDLKIGVKIRVYQPNDMFGDGDVKDGSVCLEGPHYPRPHKWYAAGVVKDGLLVSIK